MVSIEEVEAPEGSTLPGGRVFDFSIVDQDGRDVDLREPVILRLPYEEGLDPVDVAVLDWNEALRRWESIDVVEVDEATNTVAVEIEHLSNKKVMEYLEPLRFIQTAALSLIGEGLRAHYAAGFKHLVSFYVEDGVRVPFLPVVELGKFGFSLVFDLDDLISLPMFSSSPVFKDPLTGEERPPITSEGRDGYMTFWLNGSAALSIAADATSPIGIKVLMPNTGTDDCCRDPSFDASISAVSVSFPGGEASYLTVNKNGKFHPEGAQLGVCPHCNVELKVEASLADISFNILKGELNTGVLADAFGDFTDTEKNTCEEDDGGNGVPAEGRSGVTQGFFASELMCSLFQGSERAIKTVVEKSVAPFTNFEHYTRDELAELDATLFNRITSAKGGLDANGDGVGDMVFPAGIPNQLLTVTTTGDIYETRQYFVELRNQQELKEAGWEIRPLRSDNNQYKIEDAPALSVNKTSWIVTTTEDAPSPMEAEFVLVHDGIGPLADETSFFNPMLYKDRTLSDLAIEVTGSPAEVSLGAGTTIDYTATITNLGKDQATGVRLRVADLLGEGLILTRASTPLQTLDCAQEIAAGIICHLRDLDFAETLEVTLQYELTVCREELLECATGVELETITTSFSVESDVEDHALENNSTAVITEVRESPDRAALVALYNAMGGPSWTQQRYWLSGKSVGDWYGVTTDSAGRVIGLDLYYVGIKGPLPAVVGDLTHLRELSIAQNPALSGSLPPGLFKLTNLRRLSITGSQLTGELPAELGSLANLEELYLYENDLGGEIPVELASLASLEHLYLSGNHFEGCLPEGLADVAANDLDTLALPDCPPTTVQTKPSTGGTLPQPVSGDAGTDKDTLVSLYDLTRGEDRWTNRDNWLSEEPLGSWHGVTTDSNGRVTSLDLRNNGLSGELGDLAGLTRRLGKLRELYVAENHQLGGCKPRLQDVPSNDFHTFDLPLCPDGGDVRTDRDVLVVLYNLTRGPYKNRYRSGGQWYTDYKWKNRNNWLTDAPVREWHGVTADHNGRVTGLSLSGNGLSGNIPAELGDLTDLTRLDLRNNSLGTEIPAELGNLSNLETLLLESSGVNGEIPAELGNLTSLTSLTLNNNGLSGEIPAALGNLTSLTSLTLNNNQLSGEIPAELGNLTSLTSLGLYGNQLSGEIPAELGNLASLQTLRLDNNELSGELGDLAGLTRRLGKLRELYVAENHRLGGCKPRLQDVPSNDFHTFDLPLCPDGGDVRTDRDVLVVLYNLTRGPYKNRYRSGGQWYTDYKWKNRNNWLTDAPVREWHGVTADHNGRVTGLSLSGNGLSGNIPAELGDLTDLTRLDLRNNSLGTEIPAELGNLSNLETLLLESSGVNGEIPAELGNLTSLTSLTLNNNGLSGEIPAALGNLTSLTSLTLNNNQLSGEIPAELGNLTSLTSLGLYGNQLSGEIPAELGNLASLQTLRLDNNELSGELGDLAGLTRRLGKLRELYVAENHRLGGCKPRLQDVPSNDFHTFDLPLCPDGGDVRTDRDVLVVLYNLTRGPYKNRYRSGGQWYTDYKWKNRNNWLTDAPVWEWHGVTADHNGRVTGLSLSGNGLSGSIPAELGNLTDLTRLDLRNNSLGTELPAELGNLTNLKTLLLESSGVNGEIPAELGNLTGLTSLTLNNNGLSGEIPAALGNLTSLTSLTLNNNGLSGEIPAELGNLTSLTSLTLNNNQLSGEIPAELGNLASLQTLRLDNNELSGELGDLAGLTRRLGKLRELYVAENHRLGGCKPRLQDVPINDFHRFDLPFCPVSGDELTARDVLVVLYNLTRGPVIEHYRSGGRNRTRQYWGNRHNWLTDAPIWEWPGVTADHNGRVTRLNLGGVGLTGEIPPELGDLTDLVHLDLRQNRLSGEIPAELGNLTNLTDLYLSGNQLTGCMPRLSDVPNNDLSELGLSSCQS